MRLNDNRLSASVSARTSGSSGSAVRSTRPKRSVARLLVLADLRHEAGRHGNNPAGTVFLAPQFADAGLQESVELGKGVELQAGATNPSDRNYFLIEGYPEPGRAGYVNLRCRV